MKRLIRGAALSVMALALAGTPIASSAFAQETAGPAAKQAPRPARPMNVLFIIADDLAPRLGNYGYPVQTPNIDRLASQAVSFDRAYSQFPWCGPSRASFLTGTRPGTTKVLNLAGSFRTALPDIQTMPQYFRSSGYFSGRVGKIFHQSVPGGIGQSGPDDPQSWDQVVNPRGRDKDAENTTLKIITPGIPYGSSMTYLEDEGADEEQTDGKVATEAIEMMRANKDKPFFIAVGFYRPHVPEVAPKKYFDLYNVDDMKIAGETPEALAKVLPATRAWTPDNFGMNDAEQRKMIQSYYAATSFMDAQVGRVLTALDELELADDTIVVFTSDHGFLLGEHGQWMKNVLWENSNRVPLIIRVPGTRNAGKRSARPVEMLDIYPTLTDLAGLPSYDRNEGKSMRPLLTRPNDKRWTKPALSQVQGGRSVRTDRWRYTEWEEGKLGRELYDHKRDPDERVNLADDPRHAKLIARLKAMLPAGPVEPRPKPTAYDSIRDCLINAGSGRPGAGDERGGGGTGGPGGPGGGAAYGVKICETIDP